MLTGQLDIFGNLPVLAPQQVVNVASVPQRSPFRYPGGKTWLIPEFRRWMRQFDAKKTTLVEPFAGGGIVSLTTAFENLAERVVMAELDEEIAAVWETILSDDNDWLAQKILGFEMNTENVREQLLFEEKTVRDSAFSTILKNRVFHGGIIAKGSGMLKNGENGRGIASRWYPATLKDRIAAIKMVRHKIRFLRDDAFRVIPQFSDDPNAVFFIDPPYTIAGKRLYTYFDIDHEKLFALAAQVKGNLMMTYDDTEEVRGWANKFGLLTKRIPMKTTHHLEKYELLITKA